MRSFSKKLAFVLAAAMVVTAFAPAAKAEAAKEMAINKQGKILYVTDGTGINDAAQVGGGKGNVSSYDFAVSNKPKNWKNDYTFAWSSSDEDVITVKNGGLTTAVGVGKADVVCVVTEKATGKATTLKNTVTVKANAAEVVITNADDYANTAIEVGTVVDLNRAMYDANGTKAPKRGVVVTDYTRWMVEPSTGVEVDSTKGTFTFTEDAVAGEYKLWAETYQSNKYKATTAKSDVVRVELVKDMTFEVAQKSAQKFVVEFSSPVKSLVKADVKVTRLMGVKNLPYPEQVSTVNLAKDGMSAEVVIFGEFLHQVKYIIDVTGFESVEKTMTLGYPTSMTIAAQDTVYPYVLTIDKPTELVCTFYNAEGVDVTTGKENVIFRAETRSTDGSYYVSGNKLTIKKENVFPVIIAEYTVRDGSFKKIADLSAKEEFAAVKAPQIVVNGVVGKTINGKYDGQASTIMRKSDTGKKLEVLIEKSDKTKDWATNNGTLFKGEYMVTFDAMNPEVAVINNKGELTAFRDGTAKFYVNLHAKKANASGYEAGTPIDVVSVTVEKDATFSYVTLDNDALTIGTADNFNTASVKLTSFDSYKQKCNFANDKNITVECNMDGFTKTAFASAITDGGVISGAGKNEVEIKFDAQKIVAVLATKNLAPKAGDAAVVYFTVKYNNKALDLTVTVQEPSKDENNAYVGNYIDIETSATYVDATRKLTPNDWNDNTEKAKTVTFKVFERNNGVKVAELPFGVYPANGDAKAVTSDSYVYRVTKDGKDYASSLDGNTVTVKFSTTKSVSNGGINASVVDYTNMGTGTYVFELYKCYGTGNERVLVQEYFSEVVVELGNAGEYKLVGDVLDNEVSVTANNPNDYFEILKCFTIKDKDGNEVVDRKGTADLKDDVIKTSAKYFVNYEAPAKSGYVYVKDITFYEKVGTENGKDVYVPYVVNIDTILNNK